MLKLFFAGTLMLLLHTASAQIQFGLKAGANISNFTGGDFEDVDKEALVAPHGGAYLRWRIGPSLAIQPEALFSVQGAKLKSAIEEFDAKISYVNIPIMVQFHFGGEDGGLFIEGGPQVGFKVNEDVPNQSTEDFAKSSDLAAALGLGFESKLGLGIGARYTIGISKVGDFESSNIDPDFKNGVIQLSLFFTF
jgi:Outer membrane protein beta-barrel domain